MKKFNFEEWKKNPTTKNWKKHPECDDVYCRNGYKSSLYKLDGSLGVKKDFCPTCISFYERDCMK